MYKDLKNFNTNDVVYALYGLMLGDGTYKGRRLRLMHTDKQKFYCLWLEKIGKQLNVFSNSKYNTLLNTTYGIYNYHQVYYNIPNSKEFESHFFNENHKKIITDYVMNNINEFGLLLWYLDDGNLHVSFKNNKGKRFAYLNTQSFSYEENCMIVKMFEKRFGIQLRIHQNTKTNSPNDGIVYRLYFNAENFKKFIDLVRPYISIIPVEFYYKFDMKYYPNRLKSSINNSKLYNFSVGQVPEMGVT